jgi:hypothetical protein
MDTERSKGSLCRSDLAEKLKIEEFSPQYNSSKEISLFILEYFMFENIPLIFNFFSLDK